jgi:alpha-L-rhamnosidase
MVGIQYIYHALSEIGRADLALRLLSESDPGYLTWYKRGESTLWEVWNGFDRGSHNHHMLSGVIAWFFRSLLGITPLEDSPGFAEIALRPCFLRELGFARGSMDTVRGRIEAEWHCERDGFVYQITLPQGVHASFRGRRLTPGTHRLFVAEN